MKNSRKTLHLVVYVVVVTTLVTLLAAWCSASAVWGG